MKLAAIFAILGFAVLYVQCDETTLTSNQVAEQLSREEQNKSQQNVGSSEIEKQASPEETKKPVEVMSVGGEPMSGQLSSHVSTGSMAPAQPMHVLNPMAGAHGPFQRQTPPYFGHPFRPSLIRSEAASFVPLPPKDLPTFDLALCRQESNSKRDLEKKPFPFRHLEMFYLNSKNQDIILSLCGDLTPAHLVVIESISPKLEAAISALKNINNAPIVINDISDLLNQSKRTESAENATVLSILDVTVSASPCTNDHFKEAFKIFLKFFYVGGQALDDIHSLEVGTLVWKLGKHFLEAELLQNEIESRLGRLITMDNQAEVYRFALEHQIVSLDKRWSDFINSNSRELTQTDRLPVSCESIHGDIVYLDRFIEALNVNQSITIGYIRQYLSTCPESSNFVVTGDNQFPRSLIYFRCSVEDLKELVKMGFMNHEILAIELENRLRVHERHCEEKCASKFAPVHNPNYRHVGAFTAVVNPIGRRA